MTTTNRLLNRLVLLVAGLVLLSLAAGAALAAVDGTIRSTWRASADEIGATIASRLTPPAGSVGDVATTWPLWSLALIAAAALVAAVGFAASRGRGRTSTMLRDERDTRDARDARGGHGATGTTRLSRTNPTSAGASAGAIEVATGFAQTAIQDVLAGRPEILSVHVSAYRRRSATALKIRVLPREGVSPRAVVEVTRSAVLSLDEVLGARVPVVLEIGDGARARMGSDSRVG